MTESERKTATFAVYEWVAEALGADKAQCWLWECTPYPFDYAHEEQLDDGFAVALGALDLSVLRHRIEAENYAALTEYNAALAAQRAISDLESQTSPSP